MFIHSFHTLSDSQYVNSQDHELDLKSVSKLMTGCVSRFLRRDVRMTDFRSVCDSRSPCRRSHSRSRWPQPPSASGGAVLRPGPDPAAGDGPPAGPAHLHAGQNWVSPVIHVLGHGETLLLPHAVSMQGDAGDSVTTCINPNRQTKTTTCESLQRSHIGVMDFATTLVSWRMNGKQRSIC